MPFPSFLSSRAPSFSLATVLVEKIGKHKCHHHHNLFWISGRSCRRRNWRRGTSHAPACGSQERESGIMICSFGSSVVCRHKIREVSRCLSLCKGSFQDILFGLWGKIWVGLIDLNFLIKPLKLQFFHNMMLNNVYVDKLNLHFIKE